jgi:hypothetical protein
VELTPTAWLCRPKAEPLSALALLKLLTAAVLEAPARRASNDL